MVIALDKNKKPLGSITERRCRILMEKKRAVIYRYYPAVVILKDVDAREIEDLPVYRIKIDPGAKYTGIVVVREDTNELMFSLQLEHRGEQVKKNLDTRRGSRRNRRSRETGYRKAKWGNQCVGKNGHTDFISTKEDGWLPPSVKSTVNNIITWVRRLYKWINISGCSVESVRFDTQLMENPDIQGVQYQQGTLYGYEIKEYLIEKYGHTCQYCGGKSGDNILEWEHMLPKSKGGSDSVKNATLACHTCNQDKGNKTLEEWLNHLKTRDKGSKAKQELNQARIQCVQNVINGKAPVKGLRYAAWVNSSRRYLQKNLFEMFLDVECSSGGRTKYNRTVLRYPKEHHYDALCVGDVPAEGFKDRTHGYYLYAKATGRGTRLRGLLNKCGIITTKWTNRHKTVQGFQTGDIVVTDIPTTLKCKYKGRFVGRVMVRNTGRFDIRTLEGQLVSANAKYCRLLQGNSGYLFSTKKAIPLGN